MKKVFNYIAVLGLACAFHACDSDLETTTYDASQAKAAVLSELESSYVLDSKKADEAAFTLKWTKPDMGYNAAVTNYIQMDFAGNEFAKSVVLYSSATDESYSVKVNDLNSRILTLLQNEGIEDDFTPRKVEFRIATSISESADSIFSNVVITEVTPYSSDIQYPEIYAIGNYSNWSWDTAQSLFSFTQDGVNYEGMIDFGETGAGDGFKITGDQSWDNGNWGLDNSATAPDAEAATVQLIDDGGSANISCYTKRFYHFTFNTETLVLTKTMGFDQLGIVGADVVGAGWSNDVVMQFDAEKQRFYADVELKIDAADPGFKFRVDAGWDLNFGVGDAEGTLVANGGNLTTPADGTYRIYVNLNNSGSMTYELNADDYGAN